MIKISIKSLLKFVLKKGELYFLANLYKLQ
jgi:hypothetical protein